LAASRGEEETQHFTLRAEAIELASAAAQRCTRRIAIRLEAGSNEDGYLEALRSILAAHPGQCPVTLELVHRGGGTVEIDLDEGHGLAIEEEALHKLTSLVGTSGLRFHVQRGAGTNGER